METTKIKHSGKNYCVECDKEIPYWNRHCIKCHLKACKKSFIEDKCSKMALFNRQYGRKRNNV